MADFKKVQDEATGIEWMCIRVCGSDTALLRDQYFVKDAQRPWWNETSREALKDIGVDFRKVALDASP